MSTSQRPDELEGAESSAEEPEVEPVTGVLQVAGMVVAGLLVYTLVALLVLAWLGHRYQQFKTRVGAPGAVATPAPPTASRPVDSAVA